MFFNKTTVITSTLLAGIIAFGSAGTVIAAPGASTQAVQATGPTVVDRFGPNRFGAHTTTLRSTLADSGHAQGPTTDNRFSGSAFSGHQEKTDVRASQHKLIKTRSADHSPRRAGVTTEQRFSGKSFEATDQG